MALPTYKSFIKVEAKATADFAVCDTWKYFVRN